MPLSASPPPFKPTSGWHNFATGQTDWLESAPATDEEAKQYLPQDWATQSLYDLYRQRGDSVEDASIAVLERLTRREE